MLEKAEQVIASLRGDYLEWVQDDLGKLQRHFEAASRDGAGRAEALQAIFTVAHDVKGQGGSFGYPLMTTIGNQLCRFIELTKEAGPADLAVIKLHIDALRLVIAQRMEGEGGRAGEELLRGLQAVAAKTKG